MSRASDPSMFNAIRGKWLPLLDGRGEVTWASPASLVAGEVDGVDLAYPRDDVRVMAKLLLSAILQAVAPARDLDELRRRVREPMRTTEVAERFHALANEGEFDLFGPRPFLQVAEEDADAGTKKRSAGGGAARFVLREDDLAMPAVAVGAVSIPAALVCLYGEQLFAGAAGSGHRPGPGGQPGTLVLVDVGSVRASAWANTLCRAQATAIGYAPDPPKAWGPERRERRARRDVGLVEGLFWQPRATRLIPAGDGACSFTGEQGPLVMLAPFGKKSAVGKADPEDLWRHPSAPLVRKGKEHRAVHLDVRRPAWAAAAQVLEPVSVEIVRRKLAKTAAEGEQAPGGPGRSKRSAPRPNAPERVEVAGLPAPVVEQWRALGDAQPARFEMLYHARDWAKVEGLICERTPEVAGSAAHGLRILADRAVAYEKALAFAIASVCGAGEGRSTAGHAGAVAAYWARADAACVRMIASAYRSREDPDPAHVRALRSAALAVFDDVVSPVDHDARRQERIAYARRRLMQEDAA